MVIETTAETLFEHLRPTNANWDVGGDSSYSRWVFRGHWNSEWKLLPISWRTGEANPLSPLIEATENCRHYHYFFLPEGEQQFDSFRLDLEHGTLLSRHLFAEFCALNEFRKRCHQFGENADQPNFDRCFDLGRALGKIPYLMTSPSLHGPRRELIENLFRGSDIGLARHYGVPTRYLDWTLDPVCAMYFAVHPTTSSNAQTIEGSDSYIAIWALNADQTQLEDYKIELIDPQKHGNKYLSAQSGLLSCIPEYDSQEWFLKRGCFPALEDYIEDHSLRKNNAPESDVTADQFGRDDTVLRKFVMPRNQVPELRRLLKRERATLDRFMPSLENMAKTAMQIIEEAAEREQCRANAVKRPADESDGVSE